MGSILSFKEPEQSEEERIKYWKCNNKRIKYKEYIRNNADEWYAEYIY